ncbi:UvrD-helicase domain-containing protein [Alkaliphilus serpentinus]|uniref:ATP-dependent helicase n=1 Tax=Alkaliphilus serpentinus TaxID=1482731 RepID=A0A833M5S8_9FIRM|nr:UvrD-helicase domain-containing protein [Alkaliphilus serpentinus]KAB3524778.1 ATP-dependent helicase [Alkaliphilus serpentinus]
MANSIVENIYIVNAPASSGKTTKIKSMVINHTIENPIDNVLCITYTNRATEELLRDLNSKNIHVSTIHSFLNKYLSIYFGHQEIIELYFELYGSAIQERIDNPEQKDTIEASNKKYSDKYGVLDMDTIKKNISRLYYNETAFNSLYYGGLSHDDLIWFSEIVFTRFQKVRERLTLKYQAIFVDEYQDSSDSVLKLFYDSVKDTSTKLYFLGDKMQQIYTNYRGGFEEEFQTLNKTISLSTNHRSLPVIIDLLNNMYNDPEYVQNPSDNYIGVEAEHEPRVIICNNPSQEVDDELSLYPQALCLYLLNQQKFDSIGASNLYRHVNRLDSYSFNKKLSATDVLSDSSSENPDQLLCLLFSIGNIYEYYSNGNLGNVLKILKENTRIFNSDFALITKHQDKIRMKESLDRVLQVFGTTASYQV